MILRIKELMKEQGVTGKALADKLGITENSLSLIVNEKRQPRYETLISIADEMGVDVRNLFKSTKLDHDSLDLFVRKENGEFQKVGTLSKDQTE